MKRRLFDAFRRTDRGLLLALALSLAAAWPFLFRPSLPRQTDAELHVFRAAELGYSLRALDLYPRWAPDFYYGYGYPIFNYYAPLTYYLANLFSLFIPGGAVFGSKLVFIATFILAGTGMYGLARHYAGPLAGLIAAASYLFAPYFYLIDSHLRGDLAEFLALGIAPAAFWAVLCYQRHRSTRHFVLASLSSAALILSHNLLGLIFFVLLAGQSAWVWLIESQGRLSDRLRLGFMQALPLILAVGLTAFFWLPVALESSAVRLHNLIGPGHFDYREHFREISELLAPSLPLDLGAANPEFRHNLGIAQWILGVVGIAGLIRVIIATPDRETLRPLSGVYWLICTISLILLMTRISQPLWESISIMAFFQFPWRFLGPVAMCLALVGGYSATFLPTLPARAQSWGLGLLTALPILAALPIFVPPSWGYFGATNQIALLEFELGGFALGTTSTGDFVPTTVDAVPGPAHSVIESYRRGGPINRVDEASVPPSASIDLIRQHPTSDTYHITSDAPFTLRLYRLMFPGWRATLDANPVNIEGSHPEGFITIPVPPGDHTLRVWLGLTPVRFWASMISAASLIALLLLSVRFSVPSSERSAPRPLRLRAPALGMSLAFAVAIGGTLIGLWQPRSTGLVAVPASSDVHHYLEGGIDLIGFDVLNGQSIHPGDRLPVSLYWKAREPVPGNYQVFVHLTTIPEHIWAQSDKLNPGDYPTTRWPLDRYVRDPHLFTIPLGTPPGEYHLRVGLWDRSTGRRQLILEQDGTVMGDAIELPVSVQIAEATVQPPIEALPLNLVTQAEVARGITLLGVDLDPDGAFTSPIGQLALRLYWKANSSNLPNYNVALRIVAPDGTVVVSATEPPAGGQYPISEWKSGSIIRDVHTLWIDLSIPAGTHRIEIALVEPGSPSPTRWIDIGQIERQ